MKHQNQGFTLIELLVVLTLVAVVIGFSLTAIASYVAHQEIERSVTTVTTTLTETRQRTLAAETDTQFAVSFATSSISWFVYPYGSGTVRDHVLPGVSVSYNFSHNENQIIFSRLRGEVNATGTVTVSHPRIGRTINIHIDRSGRYSLETDSAD